MQVLSETLEHVSGGDSGSYTMGYNFGSGIRSFLQAFIDYPPEIY